MELIAYSFAIGSGKKAGSRPNAPLKIAKILTELKRKHKSRIQIRVYLEGLRDTSERNQTTAKFLKDSKIRVKFGSTHAKCFSVDKRYVLFGSTNLTNQSILRNNEANLLIDSKVIAREFNRYFKHLWRGGNHGEIKLKKPVLADGEFKDALIEMINLANVELFFSIYFFDHPEIETALVEAHKRGVKIFGLVHHHESFALSYVRRTRHTVERLTASGIKGIRYGSPLLFTHSKFLVADGKEVALGTGNWLHEDVKIHPQLYIRLTDQPLGFELRKYLKTVVKSLPKQD